MSSSASMLTPINGAPGGLKFGQPLGNASQMQDALERAAQNIEMQGALKPARKEKKRRRPKISGKKVREMVGAKWNAAKAKVGQKKQLIKEKVIKPIDSAAARTMETDELLTKLELVFDILSKEPFRSYYDYYTTHLPGLTAATVQGEQSDATLPVDYFDNINVPPSEQPAEVNEQTRQPGQFLRGEEEQYHAAVREFYQVTMDRIHELWKALLVAIDDTDTWSHWARSWISSPVTIVRDEADALISALMLTLETMCTGNSEQDVCQVRAREKKFDSARMTGMSLDLNQLWQNHCGASATKSSREGSLLCDLGRNSSFVQLLMRLRTVPPPATLRDKRTDIVVILINGVLGVLLPESEYWQEMLDDLDTIAEPHSAAERAEFDSYASKRDAAAQKEAEASAEQGLFGRVGQAVAGKLGEVAFDKAAYAKKLRDTKRLRMSGATFSAHDLDWIADKLDTILKFDAARREVNKLLANSAGVGLEIS